MFRKVAIALLAASVLTAPALAEIAAPAKAPQSTTGAAPANGAVKTVKADKAATKRHVVARHHRHGTKMAMHKHVKHVKVAHHGKRGKVAGAGKTAGAKHAAAKPAATKPAATNGAAVN
jgi:hypothetical protein